MRKLLKSYASFSRTERAGLLVLSVVFIVLVLIKATMSMWVSSSPSVEQNNRLTRAWEEFKKQEIVDTSDGKKEGVPGVVYLNKADSATLVSLKGIGPVTAHNIITRIARKGPFTDINQLREVGGFSDSTFAALKRQLLIEDPSSNRQ